MTDTINAHSGSSRRQLLTMAAGGALALPVVGARPAQADDDTPMLMFVQLAERTVIDEGAGTLRLVNMSPQTLYFADRPDRLAGHVRLDAYLKEWTDKAGADNFGANPPNAALSVYEPGDADNTVAIVEILNPRIDGTDLIYDFKLIEGILPVQGGETALFIDRIGLGGGVGVGFHGVGVGLRGPGLR